MKITLDLTQREIELLRNSTSDLGTKDIDGVNLQLKIANAILQKTEKRKDNENEIIDKRKDNENEIIDIGEVIRKRVEAGQFNRNEDYNNKT